MELEILRHMALCAVNGEFRKISVDGIDIDIYVDKIVCSFDFGLRFFYFCNGEYYLNINFDDKIRRLSDPLYCKACYLNYPDAVKAFYYFWGRFRRSEKIDGISFSFWEDALIECS